MPKHTCTNFVFVRRNVLKHAVDAVGRLEPSSHYIHCLDPGSWKKKLKKIPPKYVPYREIMYVEENFQ